MSDHAEPFVVHFRWWILILSFAMFVVAFGAPYDASTRGFSMFLAGLFWCWLITATSPWWANVLYWIALRYYFRGEMLAAAIVGLLAAALGSTWAFMDSHAIEAPAFWLWMGSMAMLGVGSMGLSAWLGRNTTGTSEFTN
jgi:hypothetical protein